MAERREFGAFPPSGIELSNALLAEIRDRIANLSQLSALVTLFQQSFSKQSQSTSSLTVIESSSNVTVQSLESIKEKLDTEILSLSSLTTLLATQLDVLLSTRASEATLATRASENTLIDLLGNVASFQVSFDQTKVETGGEQRLKTQDEGSFILSRVERHLDEIKQHLMLITDEENV